MPPTSMHWTLYVELSGYTQAIYTFLMHQSPMRFGTFLMRSELGELTNAVIGARGKLGFFA